ncbi:MAG TPA: plastocyanin/azurin family copper-binding protein [Gemmatimonadales bacterium]|jgi:plastocyanin
MTPTIAGLLGLGALTLLGACFSERGGTSASSGGCDLSLDPSQYGSTIIAIQNFAFNPTPAHVKAGGKVTWVNCEAGGVAHTTTSNGAVWDSNLLNEGVTYTFTFPSAGSFDYHCTVHPSMVAQLIVDP